MKKVHCILLAVLISSLSSLGFLSDRGVLYSPLRVTQKSLYLCNNSPSYPIQQSPVDKYSSIPDLNRPWSNNVSRKILKNDPAPNNIDPFAIISKDLDSLSEYINDIVRAEENPILSMAATHFFRNVKQFTFFIYPFLICSDSS